MINKQKNETRSNIPQKKSTATQGRKVSNPKGYPSPNKLLKYNYKHSVDKMQERCSKSRSSLKKMTERQQTLEENSHQVFAQEFSKQIKNHHIRQSFIQPSLTDPQNPQSFSQGREESRRNRSASFSKCATEHSCDQRSRSLIKFDRNCSEVRVRKQKNSLNPYTRSQYLYVRNQDRDEMIKRKIANQKRLSFGLSLQRSCKIISVELVSPLEKYDKGEKMHKTNSTLPECYVEDQQYQQSQRPFRFKAQSKQIPISQRKKSAYYKHLRHAQGSFPSNTSKNPHIQTVFSDFQPTPWQSPARNYDLFYLRAEQL